jgi:hypothetical protein
MEGWKDGRVEEWKVGRMEGWKSGRLEEWKVGRMEGWKSGRLEDWKVISFGLAIFHSSILPSFHPSTFL